MTLNEWLKENNMSMNALAKLCGLSTTTILNITLDKPVVFRTIRKLMQLTKNFRIPITPEMFPRVYLHGKDEIITGSMAYAIEIRKYLNRKK
jgi:transcriptional regulator with XRE-family HTH domain